FSGIAGSFVSYTRAQMPTGPWVVVILSLITFVSVVMAPKGLLRKFFVRRRNENKINDENILKTIFELKGFSQTEKNPVFSTIELTEKRLFDTKKLDAGLRRLIRRDLIAQKGDQFELTASGKKEAARIIKLHRLWEQYLLKRTRIDTDHVHSGAEAIEHIITAEIEKELEKELGIEGIPEEDY
ncbi:MAG: zinc ABC transporter permease, partial [Crocinitomicaceae bacterium]|nr:zinc ABC transporter permease [Crocinitomicaceae bacterium]